MRKVLKILFLNLLVFLLLFQGTMIVVSIAGDLWDYGKRALREGDKDGRHLLPNYDDHDYAAQIFKDYKNADDGYYPILGWRKLPQNLPTLTIDENGNRVHSIGRDNDPNSRTVGFFGASTVWGTGVDDNGTLSAQFDDLSTGYSVTNYGQAGFTARQNLAQIVNLAVQQKAPDVVVFMHSGMDVIVLCDEENCEDFNTNGEARRMARLVEDAGSKSYIYRNLIVPAVSTFRQVTGRKFFPSRLTCDSDEGRARAVAEWLANVWETANTLVRSYGGEFLVVLQPNALIGSPRIDHLKVNLNAPKLRQHGFVYEELRTIVAAQDHRWFLDMSEAFDGDEYFYIDAVHVSKNGNRILAEAILEWLER